MTTLHTIKISPEDRPNVYQVPLRTTVNIANFLALEQKTPEIVLGHVIPANTPPITINFENQENEAGKINSPLWPFVEEVLVCSEFNCISLIGVDLTTSELIAKAIKLRNTPLKLRLEFAEENAMHCFKLIMTAILEGALVSSLTAVSYQPSIVDNENNEIFSGLSKLAEKLKCNLPLKELAIDIEVPTEEYICLVGELLKNRGGDYPGLISLKLNHHYWLTPTNPSIVPVRVLNDVLALPNCSLEKLRLKSFATEDYHDDLLKLMINLPSTVTQFALCDAHEALWANSCFTLQDFEILIDALSKNTTLQRFSTANVYFPYILEPSYGQLIAKLLKTTTSLTHLTLSIPLQQDDCEIIAEAFKNTQRTSLQFSNTHFEHDKDAVSKLTSFLKKPSIENKKEMLFSEKPVFFERFFAESKENQKNSKKRGWEDPNDDVKVTNKHYKKVGLSSNCS